MDHTKYIKIVTGIALSNSYRVFISISALHETLNNMSPHKTLSTSLCLHTYEI